ncbi:hypothetical protein ACIHCQ_30045 [Streptomyces sp. NPDC052236]|uniref:hypothetical protein n=1 Tax=Streptomyces sp. NPDC052236 TaxID=3365686 RepID=UPI0037D591FB
MTTAPERTTEAPVDLVNPEADVQNKAARQIHYARAGLALALPDHLALCEVPLTPDPLEALANAVAVPSVSWTRGLAVLAAFAPGPADPSGPLPSGRPAPTTCSSSLPNSTRPAW